MRGRGDGGWVLVEIMVAVLLLGLFVGSLAAGATGLARRVRIVDAAVGAVGAAARSPVDAWEWGSAHVRVSWRPGPLMDIRVVGPTTAGRVKVGIWVEGWSVLESEAAEGGLATVGPLEWDGRSGDEVVVRVRTDGEAWGSPWRSLVPGADGAPAVSQFGSEPVSGAGVIIHPPAAGNPAVQVVGTGSVTAGPLGTPFLADELSGGAAAVRLGGLEQSWLQEAGRSLDVYF